MIKGRRVVLKVEPQEFNCPLILIEGSFVGVLTGLVGAGGGFIIIPAKSLFGFAGDLQNIEIDWSHLLIFTGLAVGGIFIGNIWSHKVNGPKLKRFFLAGLH